MTYIYPIRRLSDFDKHLPQFVIATEETNSYMGADYGPPDPPPSMETVTTIVLTPLKTESEVLEWITENEQPKYGNRTPYKVFKISPVNVQVHRTISLG